MSTKFDFIPFRYRKPSINSLLGITQAKKKVKSELGIYNITKIINYPKNFQRKVLRKTGYYSEPIKILRNGLPKPGGCSVSLVFFILSVAASVKLFFCI
jgi:hypothetical protein